MWSDAFTPVFSSVHLRWDQKAHMLTAGVYGAEGPGVGPEAVDL